VKQREETGPPEGPKGDPSPIPGTTSKQAKKRPGAPRKNMNRTEHIPTGGKRRPPTSDDRRRAMEQRARDRQESSRVTRALLKERRVLGRIDAGEVGRWYRAARVLLLRVLRAADEAPDRNRGGDLSGALGRAIAELSKTTGLLERLFDVCEKNAPPPTPPGPVEYRMFLHDGTPFEMGPSLYAPVRPLPSNVLEVEGLGLPVPPVAPEPARGPMPPTGTPTNPRKQHPLDETPLQRNWRLGLTPDGQEYD